MKTYVVIRSDNGNVLNHTGETLPHGLTYEEAVKKRNGWLRVGINAKIKEIFNE